jgi:hypothetical protein
MGAAGHITWFEGPPQPSLSIPEQIIGFLGTVASLPGLAVGSLELIPWANALAYALASYLAIRAAKYFGAKSENKAS